MHLFGKGNIAHSTVSAKCSKYRPVCSIKLNCHNYLLPIAALTQHYCAIKGIGATSRNHMRRISR